MFDLGQLRAGEYQLSVDGDGADAHGEPLSYVESIVQFEVTDRDITPAGGGTGGTGKALQVETS